MSIGKVTFPVSFPVGFSMTEPCQEYASSGGGGGGGGGSAYPLNDDGTMATAFGYAFTPANAPAYQRVDWTVDNSITTEGVAAPASPFTAPALIDFLAGSDVIGIGYTIPAIPANPIANKLYFQMNGWTGVALGDKVWTAVANDGPASAAQVTITSGSSDIRKLVVGTLNGVKVGYEIDEPTGVVTVIVNGEDVAQTLAPLTNTGTGKGHFFDLVLKDANCTLGDVLSHQLVTAASSLTSYGFNNGAKDIGGVAITTSAKYRPQTEFSGGKNGFLFNSLVSAFQQNSDSTTICGDADPCGFWQDLSGNGFNAVQATSANRPTMHLNSSGVRSVHVTSSKLLEAILSSALTKPFKFYCVVYIPSGGGAAYPFVFENSSALNFIYESGTTGTVYEDTAGKPTTVTISEDAVQIIEIEKQSDATTIVTIYNDDLTVNGTYTFAGNTIYGAHFNIGYGITNAPHHTLFAMACEGMGSSTNLLAYISDKFAGYAP